VVQNGEDLTGQIRNVQITATNTNSIVGVLLPQEQIAA